MIMHYSLITFIYSALPISFSHLSILGDPSCIFSGPGPGGKRGPRREWVDGLEEDRLAVWNLGEGFAVETKQ